MHEHLFVKIPVNWKNDELKDKWEKLFTIKQEANIAIEEKRSNKEIGSSLEAELKLTTNEKYFNLLEGLDLAEYFITSKAEKFKSEKENIFIFLIILFCVFFDRYTKNEVIINFSENVFFINNFINID